MPAKAGLSPTDRPCQRFGISNKFVTRHRRIWTGFITNQEHKASHRVLAIADEALDKHLVNGCLVFKEPHHIGSSSIDELKVP
jgi:hypothetical protein